MSVVIPNEGQLGLARLVANNYTGFSVRLFQNDYTPIAGSVIGDFTEATFSGYSSAAPTPVASFEAGLGGALANWGPINFSHDGGGVSNTIYGWYIIQANWTGAGNLILQASRFPVPVVMDDAADDIDIEPGLLLKLC